MAEENGQERTEQPTPKRLRDAREKGQVARSRELSTTLVLFASALGFWLMGDTMWQGMNSIVQQGLVLERADVFDPRVLPQALQRQILDALWLLAPFFLLLGAVSVLAPLSVGGWNFSAKGLEFKYERIDPVKGMEKLFSARGLAEMLKALAKFVLLAVVAGVLLWGMAEAVIGLSYEALPSAGAHLANLLAIAFVVMSLSLALIAAFDVPFQLYQHTKQLRMTRQEVKDESRDIEGKPEVKGRIRRLQREIAQRRMMAAVPKADVVVTNPTHFAVALRYDAERMRAPKVVAKGTDLIALQIRTLATEYKVPVFRAPPLARALYYSTRLEQEVPAGLYVAVAQVLAYVFHLRRAEPDQAPAPPEDLPIPEEFIGPNRGRRPDSGAVD